MSTIPNQDLSQFAWPASQLGAALAALARQSGLQGSRIELGKAMESPAMLDGEALDNWLEYAAHQLGIEVESVETSYGEVESLMGHAAPALLRLPTDETVPNDMFLALLKTGRGQLTLLTPELVQRSVPIETTCHALRDPLNAPLLDARRELLAEAGVAEERRETVLAALLNEQLGTIRIGGCWLLRLPPNAGWWAQVRHTRLFQKLITLFGANVGQPLLLVSAWWLIGRGALQGHFEWVWLVAWALALLTMIPFQLLMSSTQGILAIDAGGLFKQRLLYGILRLEPEEISHQGAGQFLGRVMESESLELLALTGGFAAFFTVVQLATAAAILSMGIGGWLHSLLLIGWVALILLLGWLYARQGRIWLDTFRQMTNDMVERMVGYRTRVAQEDHARWHDEEDRELAHYLDLSAHFDHIGAGLNAIGPRGWLVLGLGWVLYLFVTKPELSTELAISLGGVMLAFQALSTLILGMRSVVDGITAWGQVAPLLQAAGRPVQAPNELVYNMGVNNTVVNRTQTATGSTSPTAEHPITERPAPMIMARDLVFRYRGRTQPVLRECKLDIYPGDRLLLEGESGGGKSTLAALLAGLRTPDAGLLLLRGLDHQTLGADAWRQHVVSAPQFHENHVFTETFAFNLLIGRRWPALPDDLMEAYTICEELGLSDLINRMPAGFQQMVGESGWQLSHGERSRLYIARALLQQADFIILDESFAALDPENLRLALECVLRRAPALMVIAHP
ncbi:MAG: ABC transporter ATP-binding protein [Chloroflexota bacterium]